MEKFLENLLGTTDVPTYLSGFVLAFIGALVSLRLRAGKRDRLSPETPACFSWRFMIWDSLQRLSLGFLITFVAFRFTNELLGVQLTMWLAFIAGFLNDKIAGIIGKIELKARK